MVDVVRWCRRDYTEPEAILQNRADPLVDPAGQLAQHTVGAEKTTTGVMRYVENTLSCFSNRSVIDLSTPRVDEELDMAGFLAAHGTVYCWAKARNCRLRPP